MQHMPREEEDHDDNPEDGSDEEESDSEIKR